MALHPAWRSPEPALLQIVPVQPGPAERSTEATAAIWRDEKSEAGEAVARPRAATMMMVRTYMLKNEVFGNYVEWILKIVIVR
jgi:hypothetical protein